MANITILSFPVAHRNPSPLFAWNKPRPRLSQDINLEKVLKYQDELPLAILSATIIAAEMSLPHFARASVLKCLEFLYWSNPRQ